MIGTVITHLAPTGSVVVTSQLEKGSRGILWQMGLTGNTATRGHRWQFTYPGFTLDLPSHCFYRPWVLGETQRGQLKINASNIAKDLQSFKSALLSLLPLVGSDCHLFCPFPVATRYSECCIFISEKQNLSMKHHLLLPDGKLVRASSDADVVRVFGTRRARGLLSLLSASSFQLKCHTEVQLLVKWTQSSSKRLALFTCRVKIRAKGAFHAWFLQAVCILTC